MKINFTDTSNTELRYDLQRRTGTAGEWTTVGTGHINEQWQETFQQSDGATSVAVHSADPHEIEVALDALRARHAAPGVARHVLSHVTPAGNAASRAK